ncbi:uncharacterized protein [Haliotis cracherodii]|uniref:uncharacterized protein n=1 Tax=Haliotis cracherodii TaxID=6455 RepID=UPI0039E834E0
MQDLKDTILSVKQDLSLEIRSLRDEIKSVNNKCNLLDTKFSELKSSVDEMKQNHDVMYADVDAVADKLESIEDKINSLVTDVDKLESLSRRDNVIIYGIPEGEDSNVECKQKVLHILTQSVTHKSWTSGDLVRAHRLGKTQQTTNKPRPVIAKLRESDDKLEILRARATLKDAGYGVSSDLTRRQRQQLKDLKDTGMRGYFKNGRLITEPIFERTATDPIDSRRKTRSGARNKTT